MSFKKEIDLYLVTCKKKTMQLKTWGARQRGNQYRYKFSNNSLDRHKGRGKGQFRVVVKKSFLPWDSISLAIGPKKFYTYVFACQRMSIEAVTQQNWMATNLSFEAFDGYFIFKKWVNSCKIFNSPSSTFFFSLLL